MFFNRPLTAFTIDPLVTPGRDSGSAQRLGDLVCLSYNLFDTPLNLVNCGNPRCPDWAS